MLVAVLHAPTELANTLAGKKEVKKETKEGLSASKATNFAEWYTQVVVEAELISYYTVSGICSDNHINAASLIIDLNVAPSVLAIPWQQNLP